MVVGQKHVGIAFRGTANKDNVVTDLKILKTRYREMDDDPHKPRASFLWGKACVHSGMPLATI